MGALSAIGSLAGGIGGMVNGNGQGGNAYVPVNQGAVDNYWSGGIAQMSNNAGLGNTYANQIANNPYAAGMQQGAGLTGQYYTGTLAPQLQAGASQLYGGAVGGMPYARSILQTGFDPQHALYHQLQQQNEQQTMALEAAQGVSNTPYGAGTTAASNSNFNINWQNQQLQRQAAAMQAYGGYMGQMGNTFGQAGELGNAAGQAYMTGYGLPYQTYNNQRLGEMSAYNDASNMYGAMGAQADKYLNVGQAGQLAGWGQNQAYGAGIGQGLQGLGNAYQQWTGQNSGGLMSPTDPHLSPSQMNPWG
jgi:hypothetical protein